MNDSDNRWMAQAAMVSSVGLLVVVATFIGLGIGYWLDSKLGTGSTFTLLLPESADAIAHAAGRPTER